MDFGKDPDCKESRLGISHIVFLGEVVWECRSWATVVP